MFREKEKWKTREKKRSKGGSNPRSTRRDWRGERGSVEKRGFGVGGMGGWQCGARRTKERGGSVEVTRGSREGGFGGYGDRFLVWRK